MKYTKEERLDIGRRIYEGEINRYQAAAEYDISESCARNYMRKMEHQESPLRVTESAFRAWELSRTYRHKTMPQERLIVPRHR